ncbi:Alanine racemase 1 [Thalassocella blandensis]|nr:Alanine racemase 1 [Thalassocella blandensis]
MAYPTGELSVDLHAIATNWKFIQAQLGEQTACGAVVKANAYGLGVERVAPKIYQAGCRDFFVANLKEAIQLQSLVGRDARIFVLAGCIAGAESEFISRNIIPVIVSVAMLRRWADCVDEGSCAEAALKVNTGMGRLGLEPAEFEALQQEIPLLKRANVRWLMSHFACADEPGHELNDVQVQRFYHMTERLREQGVPVKTSLANSAGVFLGAKAQSDLVRPGISLYGGNPGLAKNPMQPVVGLQLPVIQVRDLPAGEYVGYGATCSFTGPRKIAIVAGGYADGIMRSLSNKGWGWLAGCKVPIVGRVSMDSTMFDVTDSPAAQQLKEGDAIELLGEHVSIDELADAAETISYEILTSFGSRYQRCYID